MTATDELRRLLGERGVEYDGSFGGVEFHGDGGSVVVACNSKSRDGILYVHAYLTPEQAVEATLGSDLKAENAKLRELVRIMHGELVSCEDNGYVCGGHKFDERVRELGIEVDA